VNELPSILSRSSFDNVNSFQNQQQSPIGYFGLVGHNQVFGKVRFGRLHEVPAVKCQIEDFNSIGHAILEIIGK
jgi:hypothetical protein